MHGYRLKSGTVGTVGTVVTLGRVGTEVTLGTVGAGVTLGTVGTVKTKHSEQLDYVINSVPEVSGLNRNLKRTINSLTMLFRGRAFFDFRGNSCPYSLTFSDIVNVAGGGCASRRRCCSIISPF